MVSKQPPTLARALPSQRRAVWLSRYPIRIKAINSCVAKTEGVCQLTLQGANRLCVRMRAPYFKKMNGIGTRRAPMRPMRVEAHCMPIYVHIRSKLWEVLKYGAIETHIVEHLCCDQRDSSPSSRPDHGIDGEGRRGIHSTCARLSLLMIESPIAYRNSQIRIHKVVLEQRLRSACASGPQMLVTYQERHGYHTYRRAEHDCA
jgi:hypothetical protein